MDANDCPVEPIKVYLALTLARTLARAPSPFPNNPNPDCPGEPIKVFRVVCE